MLGIPTSTPEFNSFSMSFFAALYSGLIYSLFTGIIVGLVIWRMQVISEVRIQKNKYKNELLKIKDKLKKVNFDQNVLHMDNAKSSIPVAANEVMEITNGIPLDEWYKKLKKYRPILQKIIDIEKQKIKFDAIAEEMDFYLKQFIRKYHSEKGVDAINDYGHIQYFIGKTHGLNYEEIKPWINTGNEQTLNNSYEAAKKDPKIMAQDIIYKQERLLLIQTTEELKKLLLKS